jgi:hypothetical protein
MLLSTPILTLSCFMSSPLITKVIGFFLVIKTSFLKNSFYFVVFLIATTFGVRLRPPLVFAEGDTKGGWR